MTSKVQFRLRVYNDSTIAIGPGKVQLLEAIAEAGSISAAARALGMNGWQEFRWVVLPQAWALARRPLVGQYTAVVKNTSLAMAIGVAELSYTSRQVETETLLAFQAFAVATAAYLLLVLLTQALSQRGEPAWRAPQ